MADEHQQHEDALKLARTLGNIEGQLGAFLTEFQREREGAAQHRSDLRTVIAALSSAVQTLTGEVREMKPLVDDYREKRAETRGAARLAHWLWVAISAVVAGATTLAIELMKAMRP